MLLNIPAIAMFEAWASIGLIVKTSSSSAHWDHWLWRSSILLWHLYLVSAYRPVHLYWWIGALRYKLLTNTLWTFPSKMPLLPTFITSCLMDSAFTWMPSSTCSTSWPRLHSQLSLGHTDYRLRCWRHNCMMLLTSPPISSFVWIRWSRVCKLLHLSFRENSSSRSISTTWSLS